MKESSKTQKNAEKQTIAKLKTLKNAEEKSIKMLNDTLIQLKKLAAIRANCKMSNSRVSGVAKELNELIKVMSVYA